MLFHELQRQQIEPTDVPEPPINAPAPLLYVPIQLNRSPLRALLDSGASDNFVSLRTVQQLGLPLTVLKDPLPIQMANGQITLVEHGTRPYITIGNLRVRLLLKVVDTPIPVILGYPFLAYFTPLINWKTRQLTIFYNAKEHVVQAFPSLNAMVYPSATTTLVYTGPHVACVVPSEVCGLPDWTNICTSKESHQEDRLMSRPSSVETRTQSGGAGGVRVTKLPGKKEALKPAGLTPPSLANESTTPKKAVKISQAAIEKLGARQATPTQPSTLSKPLVPNVTGDQSRQVVQSTNPQRLSVTIHQLAAATDPPQIELSPEGREDIINKAYGDYAARQTRKMKTSGPKYHMPETIDHSICGAPIATAPVPPEMQAVVDRYAHVFPKKPPPGLPPHRSTDHRIDVIPGSKSPAHRIYRLSPLEDAELKKQLEELLEWGWL